MGGPRHISVGLIKISADWRSHRVGTRGLAGTSRDRGRPPSLQVHRTSGDKGADVDVMSNGDFPKAPMMQNASEDYW